MLEKLRLCGVMGFVTVLKVGVGGGLWLVGI
jgi:hypothetical protein